MSPQEVCVQSGVQQLPEGAGGDGTGGASADVATSSFVYGAISACTGGRGLACYNASFMAIVRCRNSTSES